MDIAEIVWLHYHALCTGDPDVTARVVAPDHVNHMAIDEPAACSRPGPAGFLATSAWLRFAFSELSFEEIHLVTDGRLVCSHVWMRGRHTGPFVVFPPGQEPAVFPPSSRSFAIRQMHLFHLHDGLTVEHIAVRDDLGMMHQLGFVPPSPRAMAAIMRWKLSGRARRAVEEVSAAAQRATQGITAPDAVSPTA